MEATKQISLDMLAVGIPPAVEAKQNDTARVIAASLYAGGNVFDVPTGAIAVFRYRKADGTAGFYDALPDDTPAISIDGNVVTILLVEQVLTVHGDVRCEINLYNTAGEKLTTFTFCLRVQASVLTDAEIISSDYFNVLSEKVAQAIKSADDAAVSATAAAKSAEEAKIAAGSGVLKFNGRTGEVIPQTGDYTAAQVDAVAVSGGELAKTKVTYTTPKSGAPVSGETMEVIMAKVTAMYNRMVEIEAALPPIGDWVLAEDRIVYDSGGVNGRTYPWVNFDDNLDPAVYPKLYAKIGTKWSSGAPSGYFNLALLKDRFPLVSSSNFAATGGEEKHTLTTAELPKTEITLANSYGSLATTDADFSTAAASQKLVIGNPNNAWATHPFSRSFGDSKAHNNVPPYVATCAHVRAG